MIRWHLHEDDRRTLCGLDRQFGTPDASCPIWGRTPDSVHVRALSVGWAESRTGTYCEKCLKIQDRRTIQSL